MAGIRGVAQTAEIDEVIESGAEKKTLLQLMAASNHRVLVREISVSFKGVSPTGVPILVQVLRQTDAGTMLALTPAKLNEADDETLQTTAQHSASAEPSGATEIMSEEVHPQGGYTWQAPFGGEIVVKGGNRLGIAVTAEDDYTAKARMIFEE